MEVKIYEEKQNQQIGVARWKDLMTEAEYERGQYYNNKYLLRQAEMSSHKAVWDRIEELCACQREPDSDDPDYPNSFVAIITPCVEGQVASIIESNIEFAHVADNPIHKNTMKKYDAASDYMRKKNRFIDYFKDYTRQYDKIGNSIITPSWEEGFSIVRGKPRGFARLTVCPMLSVIIDGRIKDAKDIQYAEYIIHEIGFQTLDWARREYGDEKADALSLGYSRYDGENPDVSIDDQFSFTLLHVWTRSNKQHNLQLIEMDANGFILRESDPKEPYYTFVENEYPFYFSRMIPITGQLYGYGDGQLLLGLQEYQNNLADEVQLAARFSSQPKIVVDPRAHMALDQLTSNPADIAICPDPTNNIKIITAPGINPIVTQTMAENEVRAQRITRFNDLMTGNQQGVSATATQINSQMMQGSVGINDKKSDIARAMEWVDRYCLKLALQYWDKPFWASLGGESEFVDVEEMKQAPSSVPIGEGALKKIYDKMKGFFKPKRITMDIARDEAGEILYADIDFDTKVYIGRGINKDKTTMYNILTGLAGIKGINEMGQAVPVITFKQLVALLEETLGIKLRTAAEEEPDLSQTQTDIAALTGQNPIGNNAGIQKQQPVAENLIQTVPQMPSGDTRTQI